MCSDLHAPFGLQCARIDVVACVSTGIVLGMFMAMLARAFAGIVGNAHIIRILPVCCL